MPRPFHSGSLTDAAGGVRAYLHIKRLRALAEKAEPHEAITLRMAAEAMQLLAKRNRRLGRDLGAVLAKRVLTHKGASFRADCPETPEAIADLAGDGPVTVYVGRDHRRIRVTNRDRLPRAARVIGRFDMGTDFRVIERAVREAVAP
jgi:hypothetical protein